MSIQGLNPNVAALQMLTPAVTRGPGGPAAPALAQPLSNVLSAYGNLLSALTPLLMQFAQQQMQPTPNAAGLGNGSPLGGLNQLLQQVLGPMLGALGQAQPAAQPQPMNASSATQALARHFDRLKGADGNVGTRELLLAAGNTNSPPDLRNAAMFALKHPGLLGALDRADATVRGNVGEMADGRVSKGDITAALQKTAPVAGERQVLQTLKDHPEAFKGGDGLLDRAELGRIVTTGKLPNGQQASDDVRVAARFLLGRPEVFDKVDDAHLVQNNKGQGPRGDGKISLKDVETALKGQPTVQPQVLALQALAARAA